MLYLDAGYVVYPTHLHLFLNVYSVISALSALELTRLRSVVQAQV